MSTFSLLSPKLDTEILPPYHWTEEDWCTIQSICEPSEIYKILIKVAAKLKHHYSPVGFVIGPIMTGGFDSEKNMQVFDAAIQIVRMKGMSILNQLHVIPTLVRYIEEYQSVHGINKYPENIMLELFLPLISNAKFERIFAIEGWETSIGASMEYDLCVRLGFIPEIVPINQILSYIR